MFEAFFYQLRDRGIPVSPTSFIQLQKALSKGLISGLDDFYVVARAVMVKRARHFDLYDQVFGHYFKGKEWPEAGVRELSDELRQTLMDWLKTPEFLQSLSDEEQEQLSKMTPEEVMQYFLDRLAEQTEQHHGGSKWIGTAGTSPFCAYRFNPEGAS